MLTVLQESRVCIVISMLTLAPNVCGFRRVYCSPVLAGSLAREIHLKHILPWKYPAGKNTLFTLGCVPNSCPPPNETGGCTSFLWI